MFPSVQDSESSKENPTTKPSAAKEDVHPKADFDSESNMDDGEVDRVADTPITIQDTFIFCPMAGTFVLNETQKQGIFAREREMSELKDTKISIFNKFITIEFDKEDANRSKMQAIADYLKDVKDNAKEYNSALYVQGIFSFEDEDPIENWLFNSVENLKGSTIELPTNWMDVSLLINAEKWSLLYSLSMERIEKERINIPVAAFRFWEQQELNEVMDKSIY